MTLRNSILVLPALVSLAVLAPAPADAQVVVGADPAPAAAVPVSKQPAAAAPAVAAPEAAKPAQEGPSNPLSGGKAKPGEPLTGWKWWTTFIDGELEKVGQDDRYGVTSQLPKGYASIKWDYTTIKASDRFDAQHNRQGAVIKPINLGSTKLDVGLSGKGGGHVFQASYGILGNFDWYFELPFQFMDLGFHPRLLDAEGKPVANAERAGLQALVNWMPKLGRPIPGLSYKSNWVLGDINTGFSWNPWRTKRQSIALTCRVFFPTGRVSDPNDSLFYATGPELDTGLGGWALGFTAGYDLRIYKYSHWVDIVASSEFSTSYGFKQSRPYPTNFTKPTLSKAEQMAVDPAGTQFPDLSHLKKGQTFDYTPGFGVSWLTQLKVQIALLGIGFGYGVQHGQEPEIDGDPKFLTMVKGLELVGQNTVHAIQVGASLSLLPLYIPLDISFNWRKMVDGQNAIIFDDYYNVILKTYIPIFRDFPKYGKK